MEHEKIEKEKEVKKAIQTLHETIIENLKRGEYYGLDQKVRNLQKALWVTSRI